MKIIEDDSDHVSVVARSGHMLLYLEPKENIFICMDLVEYEIKMSKIRKQQNNCDT